MHDLPYTCMYLDKSGRVLIPTDNRSSHLYLYKILVLEPRQGCEHVGDNMDRGGVDVRIVSGPRLLKRRESS